MERATGAMGGSRRWRAAGESVMYVYEIRIQGHLDQHWATWFEGLAISYESDGSTRLARPPCR